MRPRANDFSNPLQVWPLPGGVDLVLTRPLVPAVRASGLWTPLASAPLPSPATGGWSRAYTRKLLPADVFPADAIRFLVALLGALPMASMWFIGPRFLIRSTTRAMALSSLLPSSATAKPARCRADLHLRRAFSPDDSGPPSRRRPHGQCDGHRSDLVLHVGRHGGHRFESIRHRVVGRHWRRDLDLDLDTDVCVECDKDKERATRNETLVTSKYKDDRSQIYIDSPPSSLSSPPSCSPPAASIVHLFSTARETEDDDTMHNR